MQVLAAALNPVDYKPAEFPVILRFAITKPATPGIDFVGSIVKPAAGSSLKAGQIVLGGAGSTPFAGGALREYAVASTNAVIPLPKNVSLPDAATVGVAGMTAYQTIVPRVKKGDKVFLNGGSGGTGVFGIQFAKELGCHVTTTCSTPNVELCKSLGADRVIDYKKENVLQALIASGDKFDHAVDNVGSTKELFWQAHEYLKPGAVIMRIAGEPTFSFLIETMKLKLLPGFLGGVKRKVEGFLTSHNVEQLQQIGDWMAEGKVRTMIDQTFTFEDAPKAIEKLKTGRARGKIVVDVASKSDGKGSA